MAKNPADLCETQVIGAETKELIVPGSACPALANNNVLSVGVSDAGKGFEFVRLRPNICVILACVLGRGEVMVEGRWQSCTRHGLRHPST